MSETALKFGPEWLRNLSHGNSVLSPPSSPASAKYKLAEYRYGREEMLALFNKDAKMPDLSEFPFLKMEKCQLPLAYISMSEEEQRSWSRCVNSDVVLRLTGKGGGGGNSGIARGGGRGGSVDRGRGRGRGSYYQRGLSFEDEDGPFARPRPMERSQSMSERDQRWDDRERRFDRSYTGRGSGGIDDSSNAPRKEGSRVPVDNWRRPRDQGDEGGWRTAGSRGPEKWTRGSWRNQMDREKNGDDSDRGTQINSHDDSMPNGPNKSNSHHSNRNKTLCGWDDDIDSAADQLPEWSTEDDVDADRVGTFDASGAFMENKGHENCSEDYDSAQDDSGGEKESSNQDCVKSVTKSIRPSDDKSKVETNCVQSLDKCKSEISKDRDHKDIKIVNSDQSFVDSSKDLNLVNENKLSPKNERTCTIESNSVGAILTNITKQVHPALQRPPVNCSPNHNIQEIKESNHPSSSLVSVTSHPIEEDNFAHLEKATENMVAEWTAEEEQRVTSQIADKTTILPIHHDDAYKWFYRDPQGEIQGPFTPAEMLEWFTAGYFTMALMVRRGCDERFAQLGELIKTWGKVPFMCNTNPPPLRVNPLSNPMNPPLTQNNVPPPALQQSNKEIMRMIQQHLLQQQIAQQMIRQQAQIQQLINQLKQEESFNNLSPQQQQMVVTQHLIAQQQLQRSSSGALNEQQNILDLLSRNQIQPPNLSIPQILKNDGGSLWGSPPTGFPVSWPFNANNSNQSGSGSIWDIEPHQNRMLEDLENERERKKKEKEEEERRKAEEEKRRLLEEQKRAEEEKQREEEKRRKEDEERRRQEELKKQEEERRRQEELKKQQEEERRRREEELRRQEEERREELRKEELRKQEEERKRKELEHQRQLELELKRELELKKELELQKERERQKELEIERQKELEWQKELQKQRQQEALRKLQEQQRSKPQAPAWGGQTTTTQLSALSLTEIQKLQEEKEKQEQNEKRLQQLQLQHMQALQQTQSNKSSLTWAQRSGNCNTPVKSLLEIQQEEAQRIAWQQKQLKQQQQQHSHTNLNLGNSGVWGNSTNQLLRSSNNTPWNTNDIGNSVMAGFWDDAVTVNNSRKNVKSNDSAFPSLCNIVHPVNETSNKAKIVKAKKEEENVLKLFETHTKPNTDKFTQWCFDALSNLPALSVDVPTFVVFLKDIESPYEVHDYVKSYLGESKEAREFAKQFLERRSKFRNQSKQIPAEENMWGPAPAITPSVNKSSSQHEFDSGIGGGKGKKKKKNRMQKVDNSMLGFTVQPDPDRINVGEIDHIDGI